MAGKGSRPGERRGGRKPGSQTQKRKDLSDLLDEKVPGFDPVVWLASVAAGQALDSDGAPLSVTLDQRIACAKEVSRYVRPTLKAVELSGPGGGFIPVQLTTDDANL